MDNPFKEYVTKKSMILNTIYRFYFILGFCFLTKNPIQNYYLLCMTTMTKNQKSIQTNK